MDNARLYDPVRDADRRKNEFLAMLAHELRNPLAPIRHAAHILRGVPDAPDTVGWARDVISRQAQHMARLIDDLLDVSRIVHGKVIVQPQPLALSSVVERCVESMTPRLAERHQVLRLDLPAQPVTFVGDALRLAQVLSNLVHNASKFSPPGTAIVMRAWVEPPSSPSELVISILDQGCGLDPALQPRIFDLFVQGERALDRSEGGLGVGLTLVRHLVELHGGQVRAFSAGPGQGTEVVVRLPLAPTPSAMSGVTAAPAEMTTASTATIAPDLIEPPARAGVRVLVVDDQAASTESLTLLLEMEGFEVRVASDGPQGLRIAQAFRPHAVLLDIGLPGMSGFEVASRLRQDPACRNALLIALTGYGEAESRTRSAEAGFDVHMVKPADVDRLLALLADPQAARRKQVA